MQFDPDSVKEYERKVISKGNYDFEVLDAENTFYEKDGESFEQIRISIRVFYDDGSLNMSCWLGFCPTGRKMKLLKAFCKGVGLDDQWKKGVITPDDCVGKAGVVKIGIWEGKNSINWFIESDDEPKPKDKAAEFYSDIDEAAGEDDFPF